MRDSLNQSHIAGMRWTILRTLMVGGHIGATDKMCLDVCRGEYIGVGIDRVRTELDYLEARKLVEIERSQVHPWRAKLTRHGRDFVDYEIEAQPGITRPPLFNPHVG